ncbi:hypothetical protein [Nocardioides sp. B-3]|uniref:hypothetical protein n=1 Tax=Nocardioides sp. B-3 TaxID=2895565 RepID=UPI002152E14A|nr:hypothetical protein [Nocardioides sp. B-3]UUZ58238.1 hypothetical protein LP418_18570 [Nocardioides sp. B-3]
MALTLLALAAGSLPLFPAASLLAGTGFGTAFLGIMRSLTPLVGTHQRGELFAAVFVASYPAFGLPAVPAGFVSGEVGLRATTCTAMAPSSCSSRRLLRCCVVSAPPTDGGHAGASDSFGTRTPPLLEGSLVRGEG